MPRSLTPLVRWVIPLSLAVARSLSTRACPRGAGTARATPPAKIELHAMRVNGTVLSYRLAGDQGPVVFVHGSYGDMND
jgi:hypothetical protein